MRSDAPEKVLAFLFCATLASVFAGVYVWQDWPDASDAGDPTLSGWLVDTFGPQSARSMGVAIFSGLTLLLIVATVLFVRWWHRTAKDER